MSHIPANIVKFHSKLNEFRMAEKYVDVNIECGDRTFKCHRLALAMSSDYFDVMFGGNFRESSAASVPINEVSSEIFEQVLNFIYTGDVVINSESVSNLLKASDFLRLSAIEDLCLKYVQNIMRPITVKNIFDIFEFAHTTNRNKLKKIMSRRIARHFDICSETDLFLEKITFKDLRNILCLYYSVMPVKNEEMLLNAVIRWVHYRHAERSQHFDEIFRIIHLENISPQYVRLLINKVTMPTQQQKIKSVENAEISSIPMILDSKTFLHVYVRYDDEELARIFSISNDGNNCTTSGEFPIPRGVVHGFRHIALNSSYLYCLSFYDEDPLNISTVNQTFSAFTSVGRSSRIELAPPPLVFQLPHLCHVQNNIYVYNAEPFDYPTFRIDSPDSNMFTDEELSRSVYVYNCDLNKWFPISPTKRKLQYSCMTACNNIVYLIGGCEADDESSSSQDSDSGSRFMQAYDFRTDEWQEFPKAKGHYITGAGCCTLDGNIYLCGGYDNRAERFDPVAGKWETIAPMNAEVQFHLVKSYQGKVWVMGSYSTNDDTGLMESSNDMSIDIYDPKVNQWSRSLILGKVVQETINPTTIIDCVVFR